MLLNHVKKRVIKKVKFSQVCRIMFKFLLACSTSREENKPTEEEMDSEKEEEESEEEVEPHVTGVGQALGEGDEGPTRPPVLTKAETRELRRVRRLEYSWLLSGPHDS